MAGKPTCSISLASMGVPQAGATTMVGPAISCRSSLRFSVGLRTDFLHELAPPPGGVVLWEGKEEGGPFANGGVSPDGSAVPLNDALDRGQADPRPGKFALAVEAAERSEQLPRVLHVEA